MGQNGPLPRPLSGLTDRSNSGLMCAMGTAERILEAADEVLAEVGYEAASVRLVAERAGVNKALIFYHFETKSALFDRVLEGYYEAHLLALQTAFEEQGTPRARLHCVLEAYLGFMQSHRRYPRMVQHLLTGSGEKLALVTKNLTPLYAWVEGALAELCPEAGPLAARQFFVSFSSLVTGYFTYAPALEPMWSEDPLGPVALAERGAHMHWLMDRIIDGLEAGHQA